jgi:tRNA(fMet)-specific endonuclease VapC
MTYALDADTISFQLKGLHDIKRKIDAKLAGGNIVVIPPISYYEVLRGLVAINATKKLQLFEGLNQWLGQSNMERSDWIRAAYLFAECKAANHTMEGSDLLQAAYCLQHGFVLVTHNTRHYSHLTNLTLEDWV